jgi:hypothetical protein
MKATTSASAEAAVGCMRTIESTRTSAMKLIASTDIRRFMASPNELPLNSLQDYAANRGKVASQVPLETLY